MDVFDKEKRSWIMSRIEGLDTKPELLVRSIVHRLGYRFRLHKRDMPGNPDIVFSKKRKVIFVHGCFWHGHKGCLRAERPTSNIPFWRKKLDSNIARDRRNIRLLKKSGWQVLIIWQCQTKNLDMLILRIEKFLRV
jgi:DNA mismatch endonuclease (patch repair protein)